MGVVKKVYAVVFVFFFVFQALPATVKADEVQANEAEMNQVSADNIKAEVIPYVAKTAAIEPAGTDSQGNILEAVKAAIKDRSKTAGTLDIYDSKIEKVRNLDLMNLQPTVTKDGDDEVVTGDFRDTKSGDVVTLAIKVANADGAYKIKDTLITNAQAPQAAKEEKKDFTDGELQDFMKDYITAQAQTTGTFDLYDEKLEKMRNLELVKLDEKVRRYGIVGISTAEFKDKNSGDAVMVDVNTENKNGLSVTAMRIKSVAKASKE